MQFGKLIALTDESGKEDDETFCAQAQVPPQHQTSGIRSFEEN